MRILVVGASGAGKTTLARGLAARLHLPRVELDALQHGPGWVPRPTFASDVDAATAGPAWVADGNYAEVRELLWSRADAVVWLDLPRTLTTWRALRRSVRRWVRRETLWHGNRETGPLGWLDPEHPIRWSWSSHPRLRAAYGARFADPGPPHLVRLRLTTPSAVRALLDDPEGHLVHPVAARPAAPAC